MAWWVHGDANGDVGFDAGNGVDVGFVGDVNVGVLWCCARRWRRQWCW